VTLELKTCGIGPEIIRSFLKIADNKNYNDIFELFNKIIGDSNYNETKSMKHTLEYEAIASKERV